MTLISPTTTERLRNAQIGAVWRLGEVAGSLQPQAGGIRHLHFN
jgi:hypothetical protein